MGDENEPLVLTYDLDLWQAKAAVSMRETPETVMFQLLLPSMNDLVPEGIYIGGIDLLWLREPFFVQWASQGESDTVVYQADGKTTYSYAGKENPIEADEWRPPEELPPRHNRFLFHHPYGSSFQPDALTGKNEYRIRDTGLQVYPNGDTLTEKVTNWWQETYGRNFMEEENICVVHGVLR